MTLSLSLYRDTRRKLAEALRPILSDGLKCFALYGAGEAAELAYLTLREVGIEPVAVYAGDGQTSFLGLPVEPKEKLTTAAVDRVIVASFGPMSAEDREDLRRLVPEEKLIFLDRMPLEGSGRSE